MDIYGYICQDALQSMSFLYFLLPKKLSINFIIITLNTPLVCASTSVQSQDKSQGRFVFNSTGEATGGVSHPTVRVVL